jgi:hypothetical protein
VKLIGRRDKNYHRATPFRVIRPNDGDLE